MSNLQQGITHLHIHVKSELIIINGSTLNTSQTHFNEESHCGEGKRNLGEDKKSVYIVSLGHYFRISMVDLYLCAFVCNRCMQQKKPQ